MNFLSNVLILTRAKIPSGNIDKTRPAFNNVKPRDWYFVLD